MRNQFIEKVAVFSGSSEGTAEHVELAKDLGRKLAINGLTVVNGGGPGLMEVVAKSAFEAGGKVVGVHFEHEQRKPSRFNTETISFKELRPRQQKIIDLADAFVALPGGLGTTFELLEVLAKKYLGEIDSETPIVLASKGFWTDMNKMMAAQVESGFMRKEVLGLLHVVDTAEEIIGNFRSRLRIVNH